MLKQAATQFLLQIWFFLNKIYQEKVFVGISQLIIFKISFAYGSYTADIINSLALFYSAFMSLP